MVVDVDILVVGPTHRDLGLCFLLYNNTQSNFVRNKREIASFYNPS